MKLMIKTILAIILIMVLLLVLGNVLDVRDAKMGNIILGGIVTIIAVALVESRKAKNQKRYQTLYEKTGSRPIGFIRTPRRIQAQVMMLMILMWITAGLIIVAGVLCYQDGALKGEALLDLQICGGLIIAMIIFLGVWIHKMKQEIGCYEDGVMLYKAQGELLPWREFGNYEKRSKRISFYNRNGDKLFVTNETNEGYAEFWRLYQMHVEGLTPYQYQNIVTDRDE